MNTTHANVYSEEEKKILLNYLVLKSNNCKNEFKSYVQQYVENYGTPVEQENRVAPKVSTNIQVHDIVNNYYYDSSHIMWGNENNDNLVTYILSHPDFDASSNARLKALNFLHPNWDHINKEGNNALHCLAKSGNISAIQKVKEMYEANDNLKNNEGFYYTNLLLSVDAFPVNKFHAIGKDNFAFIRPYSYAKKIIHVLHENIDHFFNLPQDKILVIKSNIDTVKENMINFLDNNPKYDRTKSKNIYNDTFADLDKFISYVYLQSKVQNVEKVTNRVKI